MLFRSGSFGGTWSAGVKGDKAGVAFSSIFGGTTDASILNRLGYLDVTYYAPIGEAISESTILDDAPEFTLLGSAVGDAVFDRIQKLSDSKFRYYYKDSNPGNTTPPFKPGSLQLQFVAGGWAAPERLRKLSHRAARN